MAKFDDNLSIIEYAGSTLIKNETLHKCDGCEDLTYWLDINFGAFLCSEECEDVKWDNFFRDAESSRFEYD